MPRMIDLIRASAVPGNILQSAAKGALAMPAAEMIEILVYLANHNKAVGEQARLTLAGWDEKSSRALATDPQAPKEVLDYMVSPHNVRPALLPLLLENLSVSDSALAEFASAASRELVEAMLKSARVMQSQSILTALSSNPNLNGIQAEAVKAKLSSNRTSDADVAEDASVGEDVLAAVPAEDSPGAEAVLDPELTAYLTEHAAEIEAEADKPFLPIGGSHEEILSTEQPHEVAAAAAAASGGHAAGTRKSFGKKTYLTAEEQRGSALQKISKLDVKGRIHLAMKGSKEERSILVRDGTKLVALAVLESPKVTDAEVEMFASQKNVLEALLRGIPMKRRFVKNYAVIRNLVFNPRTPLDVSLTLMKNLLINDLRNLSGNKEVSETVRKLALKMFKQKRDPTKGS